MTEDFESILLFHFLQLLVLIKQGFATEMGNAYFYVCMNVLNFKHFLSQVLYRPNKAIQVVNILTQITSCSIL